MKRAATRAALLLMLGLALGARAAPPLLFVTEEQPPASYLADDGKTVIGTSTALLREMLRRLDLDADFALYAWRMAFRLAQSSPETCVYSTARTEAREKLFKWVGPISENTWVVYALADSPISARQIEDLRPYNIGGYYIDAKTLYLRERGLSLNLAETEAQGLKKLAAGRVDLWLSTARSAPWLAEQLDIKIKPVLVLRRARLYAACNPTVPDALIQRMNVTLREMRQDGSWARIAPLPD